MAEIVFCRYLEGAVAYFSSGCKVTSLTVHPSNRITNWLSVKADANTISITWRPSRSFPTTVLKALLESVAGNLRFCYKATPAQKTRWGTTTVAGFYQPEHAQAALKWLSGMPEYCLPNGRGPFVRETPRQGNVTLRLTGIRRDVVADVKKTLEAAFLGSVAAQSGDASHQTTHREIWHDFFATVPGYIWLQHLGRKVGCLVTSDKLQQRIRVYSPGSKASHLRSIEEHLAAKSEELDSSRHTQIIKCEPKSFRAVLSSGTLVKLQERLGDGKVSLNILEKSLVLNCSLHEAHVLARHFDLPLPRNPIISFPACPQCGDKTEDIILSCRHVSCKDCFDHQIRVAATDLTGNHFPLVCWHEGCGRSVTIVDLRKYASGTTIDALLKASFIGYVRSRPELYRNCRTPNCNSVYLHDSSYEIFICPTCLTQTCTNCHVEPHVGWTCADYDQHLQATRNNELLLNKYKAAAGTKTCPKCASLIEKVDGCDLLECSCCHAHLCWQCWTVHASIAEAYKHMRQDH